MKPSNYETRSNQGSQEKREALGALNTKGFNIDRRGKRREEKKSGWPMEMLQKYNVLLECISIPREGKFGFKNCMEYFVKLGLRKFILK